MRFAILTKTFRFEAAHRLSSHRGKCARPHGHSYRLEVTVRGPIKNEVAASDHGMVIDFADLSRLVHNTVLERLDHRDLNGATGIYTTAENLVHWIWDTLVAAGLPEDLLYRIRLWETEGSYVEISAAERTERGELTGQEF